MKKSDIDIQNENAILLAIALADGYFPANEKEYKREFNRKLKTCGISDYKEAFNFVYAGMPQFVGTDAIYAGKLSLANKDRDYIDFSLGNNEQFIDEYNNIPAKIIETFIRQNMQEQRIDVGQVLKNKYTLYDFLSEFVIPKLLSDKLELRKNSDAENLLKDFQDKKVLETLFDLKFDAIKRREKCHGNGDFKYYSLTHGMLDSVIDLYGSALTAFDEKDIDVRSISPYTQTKRVNPTTLIEEYEDNYADENNEYEDKDKYTY